MIGYRTGVVLWFACLIAVRAVGQSARNVAEDAGDARLAQFVDEHCFACHGYGSQEGGLAIDELLTKPLGDRSDRWESVVRKLVSRQMPPAGEVRPAEEEYDSVVSLLVRQLDQSAQERPNPGRTTTFRRLNRTEYQNAIRDLLALEIDADAIAAGRRGESRIRQHHGGRPVADAARPIRIRGSEDQPAGGRCSRGAGGGNDVSRPPRHHPG